jgi:phosphate transport system permease protein
VTAQAAIPRPGATPSTSCAAGLKRRYRRERRFRLYGIASVLVALGSLALLFTDIVHEGLAGLRADAAAARGALRPRACWAIAPGASDEALAAADYEGVLKQALLARFPEVTARADKRELFRLLSAGAGYELRERLMAQPALLGRTETLWLVAHGKVDAYVKEVGRIGLISPAKSDGSARSQAAWLGPPRRRGALGPPRRQSQFPAPQRRWYAIPTLVGIWGAFKGSL